MSLWKNTDGPKDAPVWYARHCVFNGKNITNNKINLSTANTKFKTGDCVIYLSNTPITGLTNEGVYYIHSDDGVNVSLHSSRANAKSGTGTITLTATTTNSSHLFVEYDRKSTTNEGKERHALIAVDKETAKLRVNGLVSPGWYRYFTYKNAYNQDRFRAELLAGVKTMSVTVTPKYTVTIQGMCCDDISERERYLNGWWIDTGLVHNLFVMKVTATENISEKPLDFVVEAKDKYGMNLITGCDPQFTFSDVSDGESGAIAIVDDKYKKTYSITANAGETITKIWKQETGEPIVLESPITATLTTVSTTIGDNTAEQSFQLY